jgi:uncharacterized protein YukE
MDTNNTSITYAQVESGARTIQECSKTMMNIFDSFNTSMTKVGADDVFAGDASETLGARYKTLKGKFDNYVKLVDEFAAMLLGASAQTQQTEQKLASEAEHL